MPAPKKPKPRPLSQCLSTAHWFAQQLGFANNNDMLRALCHTNDEQMLDSLRVNATPKISPSLLRTFDENIATDLATINRRRRVPIVLKYFQYLAVLASEYALYRIAESPENLAAEITDVKRDADNNGGMPEVLPEHLNKLAFWMATGAGKTLIMHLNILQFRRYQHGIFAPDNTIIITPNETMTAQHLAELRESDIPARLFSERGGMFGNSVVVLDIHKLSDKSGKKGVTLPPETFAGRNLIFVDEGHKGSGGGDGGYFNMRDILVENGGFAFEYSATFGQAIAVAKNMERTEEYGRAILFDYSYRYFYQDQYGKDFFILNTATENDQQDRLMFANLLAFFQQQLAWQKHPKECAEFQIEKPLLLMLGAKVTGGVADSDNRTDIIKIAEFLRRVTEDKDEDGNAWTEKMAGEIIRGKSGINNEAGKDLFADKFDFLHKKFGKDTATLCNRLRELVFRSEKKGALQFRPLIQKGKKNGQPEIALQVSGAAQPFAIIYVGESNKLVNLAKTYNFTGLNEFIRRPLFPHINDRESPINILIGAKKFMEGWSSWRVCSIGLLNVGQGEGPLIIQLFGRGVRLQGKNWSLKRSGGIGLLGDAKTAVQLLETLNIFAVRAKFMGQFREYLEHEGALSEQITLPVFSHDFAKKKLHYPSPIADNQQNNNGDFSQSGKTVILRPDTKISVTIDLTSRYTTAASGNMQAATATIKSCDFTLDKVSKEIDTKNLYCRMQEYISSCGWRNAVISHALLLDILEKCTLVQDATETGNVPKMFPSAKLQHIAFSALKQYADKVYGKSRRLWEKDNMNINILQIDGENKHSNFVDYTLHLQNATEETAKNTVQKIKKIVAEWKEEGKKKKPNFGNIYFANVCFANVYFERHLSQPLLGEILGSSRLSPQGLNKGELQFVEHLRNFVDKKKHYEFLEENAEIFLLRNLPKSGVCLTLEDGSNFYPDFMLWILSEGCERLVFIDPKGLLHFGYNELHKTEIWEYLQDISSSDKFRKKNFQMDSFIVSVTPYDQINIGIDGKKPTKEELHKKHVLFLEDLNPKKESEAAKLFSKMLMPS